MRLTLESKRIKEAGQDYPKRFNLLNLKLIFHYFWHLFDGEYFGTPRFSVRRFYVKTSLSTTRN